MYDPYYNNPERFQQDANAIIYILRRQLREKDTIIAQQAARIKELETQLGIHSEPNHNDESTSR